MERYKRFSDEQMGVGTRVELSEYLGKQGDGVVIQV